MSVILALSHDVDQITLLSNIPQQRPQSITSMSVRTNIKCTLLSGRTWINHIQRGLLMPLFAQYTFFITVKVFNILPRVLRKDITG